MLPKQDVLTLFVTLEFMGATEHMLQKSCDLLLPGYPDQINLSDAIGVPDRDEDRG